MDNDSAQNSTPAPVPVLICPQCHQPVKPEWYYCPNCGKKLSEPGLSTSLASQLWLYAFSIIIAIYWLSGDHELGRVLNMPVRMIRSAAKSVGSRSRFCRSQHIRDLAGYGLDQRIHSGTNEYGRAFAVRRSRVASLRGASVPCKGNRFRIYFFPMRRHPAYG